MVVDSKPNSKQSLPLSLQFPDTKDVVDFSGKPPSCIEAKWISH